MPKAVWGAGKALMVSDDDLFERRARLAERIEMRTPNRPPVYYHGSDTTLPGQFNMRSNGKCAECDELIHKNDVAGYNDDDEIVCEDCWVPYADR